MLVDLVIRNYKSLRDVHLRNLPPFSVMVGANASGKSNLVDALDFLSVVSRSGLAAAVRAKGGYENICFRRARRSKAGIEFEVTADAPPSSRLGRRPRRAALRFEYSFGFRAETQKIAADYRVTHESLTVTDPETCAKQLEIVRRGDEARLVDLAERPTVELGVPPEFLERFVQGARLSQDELLWPTRLRDLPPFWDLSEFLGGCRVYQVSPEMARKPGIPERSPELGRQGDNLPAAVEYLKRNEAEAFEELRSHLRHAVPTMENLGTEYVETKELGLFFRERGVGRWWYAQDVSDGTLKTVGMFLPLLDPRVTIVAIEEPENSIHPWILRHFIEVCKVRAGTKQIFLTTHSPVAVGAVPLESLFIVRRKEGHTEIGRLEVLFPEAREVLEEELFGLGEYWDSGAIGGIPEAEPEPPEERHG